MENTSENIALFDMDGTLCDHDLGLKREMDKLQSPQEFPFKSLAEKHPDYILKRADLIRKDESWWANLPRFKLGWEILREVQKLGFHIMILTQGPRSKPRAWSGKMVWLKKHLPDTDVTITRDKGLVYGKVLVDDFPGYIKRWLKFRPRGLVIMPANPHNKQFHHPQVIRYDGTNLRKVKKALKKVYKRNPDEPLKL